MIATKVQWAAGVLTIGGALTLGGVWAAGQERGGGPPAAGAKAGAEPPGKSPTDQAALAAQLAENRKLIEQFELLAKEHAELQALANRNTTDLKRAQDDGAKLKRLNDEMLRPLNTKIRQEYGLAASGQIPKDPAAKAAGGDFDRDIKALAGEWVVVGLEANGHKATADELKGMRWSVRGTDITATDPNGTSGKMSFKLDPGLSPKAIDLTAVSGGRESGPNPKPETIPGIYELEDGRLRICMRDTGVGGRPKEFVAGPGQGLITLERARPR